MGDFDIGFQNDLKRWSWSMYSVGIFMILLRLYARAKRLGISNYQVDDYLQMLAGGLFTALVVCLNVISQGGGSNLYPPEEYDTFTETEIQERIYGSKIVVISEQAMLNVIYTIKVCMLIMYTRLTLGLAQRKAVTYLAFYVGCGWLASEIAFFTACRPFEGYWGMPPPDPQCTTLEHYAIVQGCFNISSDLLMLCIPIPLILKINMPWKQKLVLLFVFSLGSFVIVAALLTKIFNLSNIWDPTYMLWYVREASVAVYVSNLPMIWPLMRDWFPCLRNIGTNSYPAGSRDNRYQHRKGSQTLGSAPGIVQTKGTLFTVSRTRPSRRRSITSLESEDLEMATPSAEYCEPKSDMEAGGGYGSQEEVLKKSEADHTLHVVDHHLKGIQVERTIVVHEEQVRESDQVYTWEHQGVTAHRYDIERKH